MIKQKKNTAKTCYSSKFSIDFKTPDLQRRNAQQSMYRFQLSVNLIIKNIHMIIFNKKSSSCSQLSRIFFSYDVNIFHHVLRSKTLSRALMYFLCCSIKKNKTYKEVYQPNMFACFQVNRCAFQNNNVR